MRREASWLAALGLVWIVGLVVLPLLGPEGDALRSFLEGDETGRLIVLELRLPRVLLGLLVGGALAMGGAVFQALFRNPLAEPYTLGVAGAAALGAVLAIHLAPAGRVAGVSVATASFLGAAGATAVIVALAARRRLEPTALLLAGVAVALSCSALILFLQYLADFTQTFQMVRWMMGGLAVVGYREVLWVAPWTVVGAALLWLKRRSLDQLSLGEELAAARGVDVRRDRLLTLGTVSMMTGAVVAVAGPIGFVGLLVPHLLRRLVGAAHQRLLLACLFGGGLFLAVADLAARLVLEPAELPVGVLTALLGGPFLFWLLLRRR